MCGLTGSIFFDNEEQFNNIENMTLALQHRGPDNINYYSDDSVILGHTRLAVIDTNNIANQPMIDNSNRYVIVFNGEIYNYQALQAELKSNNILFKTHCDTEVLLEGYKLWGKDIVSKLSGMFVFAIWDKKDKKLFIARDRMGEKPLYFSIINTDINNPHIIFASELKSLIKHGKIKSTLNNQALQQYLYSSYILTDTCIINNIQKLKPAHFIEIKLGQELKQQQYWDLAYYFNHKNNNLSINQAQEELSFLLNNAIKEQLVSDVPIGAFLSGGLDSSSIAAGLKAVKSSKELKTFSIGFNEKSYSELDKSSLVSKILQIPHFTKIVTPDITNTLKNLVYTMDEPFADSSMMPMYCLANFAKEQITVALSGDGADELFLGYETYAADKIYDIAQHIPKPLLQLSNFIANKLPTSFNKVSLDYKLKKFTAGLNLAPAYAHFSWRSNYNSSQLQQLLKQDIIMPAYSDTINNLFNQVKNCHYLDIFSFIDLKTYLVDDILVKVDRTTMAHSLEARTPFLNHKLVEFAASLPVKYKLKLFNKKYILKKNLAKIMPKNIINQKKRGFSSPISIWLQNELKDFGKSITLDSSMNNLFNLNFIEQLWQEHSNKKQDHSLKLFNLICFSLWQDSYLSQ